MGNCGPNIAVTCGDMFTDEILAELGYDDEQILELKIADAVW